MKEPIVIVDETDTPVGAVDRTAIDYEHQIYRVAALWVINQNSEVLIAQRKLTKKKDPGLWGPSVAGTVEQDETYEQNIYKEALEEIGLKGIQLSPLKKIYIARPQKYFCQWYVARVDRKDIVDFIIQEDEVETLAWILFEDLVKDYEKFPQKYIPSFGDSLKVLKEVLV